MRVEDIPQWVRSFELRNYSPYTIKVKVCTIKSLLTYCYEVGYLPINVGKRVKPPNPKQGLSQRILDSHQVERSPFIFVNLRLWVESQRDLCFNLERFDSPR